AGAWKFLLRQNEPRESRVGIAARKKVHWPNSIGCGCMRRVGARQDYSTVNRAKVLRRSDPKSRNFLRDSRRSGVTRLNAKNRKEKSPKTARSALRSLFYVPITSQPSLSPDRPTRAPHADWYCMLRYRT